MLCLSLFNLPAATLPFAQWSPEHWIALTKTLVWPAFSAIMVIAWHSRIEQILDALTALALRATEFSAFGIKLVAPEKIDTTQDLQVAVNYRLLPQNKPSRLQIVPEKLSRWAPKEPSIPNESPDPLV